MKNLKRVFSLLVVLAMAMSMSAFASTITFMDGDEQVGTRTDQTNFVLPIPWLESSEGQTFLGWATDANATEADSTYYEKSVLWDSDSWLTPVDAIYIDGDVTLYAVWEKSEVEEPAVTEEPAAPAQAEEPIYEVVFVNVEPAVEESINEEETPLAATPFELAAVSEDDALELAAELGVVTDAASFEPKAEASAETVNAAVAALAAEGTDAAAVIEEAGFDFSEGETITREQLVTVLFELAKADGFDVSAASALSGYTDAGEISDFAAAAFQWAVSVGLIKGVSATELNPNGALTQAQLLLIMARYAALTK